MAKAIPAGQASFTLKLNDQITGHMKRIGQSIKNAWAALDRRLNRVQW